jgi:NADH dehydrogenase
VLILGGGFGGVTVAQELEGLQRRLGLPLEVTLINQSNYMLFVPLLAEAAASNIELADIVSPLRSLLPRTRVRVEVVLAIDLEGRTVTTLEPSTHREHTLDWDSLVIALGNVVDLAGLPGVARHGLPLKTIGDALHIRNHALGVLESAENATDPDERRRLLTFVTAGGGYSGVEIAAELNDLLRDACRVYRTFEPADLRVVLLHSGQRILPEISASLAAFAHRHLVGRGIQVRTGARLASAEADHVVLQSGERLETRTLVVAIGAGTNPVVQALGVAQERGRLRVDASLRLEGQTNVWALGDCAAVPHPRTGQPAPATAQFAVREARTVARNIVAALQGRPPRRFTFTGLGEMLELGQHAAAAELLGRVRITGLPAWILWRSYYLSRLPGLERKARVWLDWNLDLLFRRDLAELHVQRTERVSLAHFEPDQVIMRQGDPADAFYVLVRGEAQVVRERADGSQDEVVRLHRGDTFGEAGLLHHRRREATVRAVSPVDVLVVGSSDFDLLAGTWQHLGSLLAPGGPASAGASAAGMAQAANAASSPPA